MHQCSEFKLMEGVKVCKTCHLINKDEEKETANSKETQRESR